MTASYVLIGIGLCIAVWLMQRRQWSRPLRYSSGLAIAAISLLGALVFANNRIFLGDGKAWYDLSPWRELWFLLLMLLGMAARYFTQLIEQRRDEMQRLRETGSDAKAVPLRFDVWEFSYPLFFSVVTFGSLLAQVDDGAATLVNSILSFQTGFFWQTLIKKPA